MIRHLFPALALVLAIPASHAQLADRFEHLKNVDVRDLLAHNTDLAGTANLIMKTLERAPGLFVGTNIPYHRSGALGPKGRVIDKNGTEVFSISTQHPETQRNTILSAEFEEVIEEQYDKVFKIKMIVFAHDELNRHAVASNGYYFRRMTVRVDWNIPKEYENDRVQVLSSEEPIPLAATHFRIEGDLLDRKVVLIDDAYGITKIFPIGVGGIDIKPTGEVKLLTQEFPGGKLKKVSLAGSGVNTRSRVHPSYYSGRPFLAVFDSANKYQQIGMHYQISSDFLIRGFVSHGCIRVRDQDLYQLDAILNEGPHDELPVNILTSNASVQNLSHPMPKEDDWYNAVVYSNRPSPAKVSCKDSSYSIRHSGAYHTVADGDCLTMIANSKRPAQEVTAYLSGESQNAPQALLAAQEHVPTAIESGNDEFAVNWESDGGQEYQVRRRRHLFNAFGLFDGLTRRRQERVAPPINVVRSPETQKALRELNRWNAWIRSNCDTGRASRQQCADARDSMRRWNSEYSRSLLKSGGGGLY